MSTIDVILEEDEDILRYLQSRHIVDQYRKAKKMLVGGFTQKYDFKRRQPKSEGIYQFRINQKYRAFGKMRTDDGKNILIVYHISDHQDF